MGMLLTGDEARAFAEKAQPESLGLLELRDHWKTLPAHRGLFESKAPFEKVWTAFDNSDGCFWIEDFLSEKHARAWLGL